MARIAPLIRVFISSTFADFQPERDVLQSVVFPRLRDYCRERGARFLPIDLRWGISEAATLDQQTVRICLEELRRCQEASPFFNFVALLGDRYGSRLLPERLAQSDLDALLAVTSRDDQTLALTWYALDTNTVPPTYVLRPRAEHQLQWESDQSRLRVVLLAACQQVAVSRATRLALTASVTEQEIEAGICQVAEPHRALCFQRVIAGMPTDSQGAQWYEQDNSGCAQLAAMKQRLSQLLGDQIVPFTATWDQHAPSSQHLEAFARLAEHHLRARIDAALAQDDALGQDREAMSLQRWSFAQSGLEHFIGRREVLQQIAAYLVQPAKEPLIVTGASGIGKTTLLLQAAQDARRALPQALHLNYFIGGNTALANLPALIRDLAARLIYAYTPADPPAIPDEPALLEESAARFLSLATAERPLILLVDALDQLSGANLTRWLPTPLPVHVHVVVSLLAGADLEAIRARLTAAHMLEVTALSPEEGATLLQKWLDATRRTLTPLQRTEVLQRYAAYSSPLYWRLLFEETRQWPSWFTPSALPPDTPSVLQALFTQLEAPTRHGPLLTQQVLGLLAAGKHGLTEDEVMDVLSQDPALLRQLTQTHPEMRTTERFPAVLWARLYADLEALLSERAVDGTDTIGFYHRQVDEAVHARYLAGDNAPARHGDLARYFAAQPSYLTNTATQPFALVNERRVNELTYQQAQAGERDRLKATLLDATFLQAVITARRTLGILEDCAMLGDDPEIETLAGALRSSAHILDAQPREVFNQLSGRTQDLARRLSHLPITTQPQFWLLSHSLAPADGGLIRVFTGHQGGVNSCALTPDGSQVLSASDDGTLRLWDIETGATVSVFQASSVVTSCDILPSGQQAISISNDGWLCVWNLATGTLARTFNTRAAPTAVKAPAWVARSGERVGPCLALADGRHALLVVETPPVVQVWDLTTGAIVGVLEGLRSVITCCALTLDGAYALTGSEDGTLQVWNLATREMVQVLEGHTSTVTGCIALPGGRQALSSARDGSTRLWDLGSGACLREVNIGLVRAVTPSGKQAISARWAGNEDGLRLWEVATGDLLGVFPGHAERVSAVVAHPDGKRALSASADASVRLWDLESGAARRRLDGASSRVNAYVPLPDGRRGITASGDHLLQLWDVETQTVLRVFEGHTGYISVCALGPDGRHLLSGSADRTLRWWNIETGETEHTLLGHTDGVGSGAILTDGRKALSTSRDGSLRVWDLDTGTLLHTLPQPWEYQALPDSKRLLTVSADRRDHSLRLWDLETGHVLQTLSGHTDTIMDFTATPDGRRALSASKDHTVRVWDLLTGATLHILEHDARVDRCVLLPDSMGMITAQEDGIIRVWDLATGALRMTYTGHHHTRSSWPIKHFRVLRDGRRVVSVADVSADLQVWDLTTGETEHAFSAPESMRGRGFTVSLDEKFVFFVTANYRQIWLTAHIWDIEQGRESARWTSDATIDWWTLQTLHSGTSLIVAGGRTGVMHVLRLAREPF